ncbi:MAG: tyrosine-type recombinase/integrase [Planctomycetota bacterium]
MALRSLQQTLEQYLALKATVVRRGTIAGYRTRIQRLLEVLTSHHPAVTSFARLRRCHIEKWLRSLQENQLGNATRYGHIVTVRLFLRELSDWRWVAIDLKDLVRQSDLPPLPHYLPRPLSPDLDSLIQKGLYDRGDLLARGLLLARFTGVRIGELTRLSRDALAGQSDDSWSIRVPLGKLHNERIVPVDAATAALFKSLQAESQGRPGTLDTVIGRRVQLLLCKADGSPIPTQHFRRALHAVAASLAISERVTPHRLRHTYATELLRHGASIPALMRLLGHRSPTMTLRYAQITQQDVVDAYHAAQQKARSAYATLEIYPRLSPSPAASRSDLDPLFEQILGLLTTLRRDQVPRKAGKQLQRIAERLTRARRDLKNLLA